MFQKLLIANRGEIAVRIIRACRELGIKTVAVYSEADAEALHTQLADEAICIGPARAEESYLHMARILSAAVASGAQAVHPGFGFLSENSKFAQLCAQCGIAFVGPSADLIARMGDKAQARQTMEEAGVPVVPGSREPVYEAEEAKKIADSIGYPVMIKAALGGGGKGMRLAEKPEEFVGAFQTAQQETMHAFGDATMYLEKYIVEPRHVEFQILADKYGHVVQLGERDCSIQRRHQKLLEESPCSAISQKLREEMGHTAVRAAQAVGYENAGTIEFLLDKRGSFYFMEMNTRIQVEHPVTEMVTGLDLVKEQIRIAAGEPLGITQEEIHLRGHAIECRINAEDPERQFMPCPGTIETLHLPGGNGIRTDTALFQGYTIPSSYDSMLVKLIVHDKDRESALRKMQSALGELVIEGVKTNLELQYEIMQEADFCGGNINTHYMQEHYGL
ncbi:MAG: acetyl-CoA carboxylase biotin carboxylase subunit [Lachnospiraceae bacterium]|nr:acetyl-CoA carboxylase biotin carboxylase subunit [Lachnospiraceae bacterium]